MDCNKAEKFDFVSSLATQPLAAFLHSMLSPPAAPAPGSNPTLIVHQPTLVSVIARGVGICGLRGENLRVPAGIKT